jgi:hypothetical protein
MQLVSVSSAHLEGLEVVGGKLTPSLSPLVTSSPYLWEVGGLHMGTLFRGTLVLPANGNFLPFWGAFSI